MSENTKIQWATHTFNPWRGCTKIAPGCANCYADAQSKRNPGTLGVWGPNGTRVVAAESMWRQPVKWNRDRCETCKGHGVVTAWAGSSSGNNIEQTADDCPACGGSEGYRPRVFCASLADVFEDWGDRPVVNAKKQRLWHTSHLGWMPGENSYYAPVTLNDVRSRLFRLWRATLNLDYLALTKRPENIRRMLVTFLSEKVPGHVSQNEGDGRRVKPLDNVWLGTSIACQEDADRNVPELLKCSDLCAKLFVSAEPLVGPVDLTNVGEHDGRPLSALANHPCVDDEPGGHGIDWVIVGGESGPNARPCNVDWIRDIVRQCRDAGVPCFVKQLGSSPRPSALPSDVCVRAIRDPKGGDPAEWPEDLRVREFPNRQGVEL